MKQKNHSHWLEKPNLHNRSVSDLRMKNSTSPQPPPKEGEQFPFLVAERSRSVGGVRGGESVRKQLPSPLNPPQGEVWRGLGGGVSGLLRSARNDDVPFSELCVSFANFALKKIKPQRTQRFSQRTQRKNLANLENLNKIVVQTKKINNKIKN